MDWKCDKCGNVYPDSVKQIKAGKFVFCPYCLSGEEVKSSVPVKKNNYEKAVKILTVAAILVFVISITVGILFIKNALIKISIPVWVGGFVVAVVLTAIDDAIMKKNDPKLNGD